MEKQTALILIDVQVNMFDPAHSVSGGQPLLDRLRGLLQRARTSGTPVIFVRNCGGESDPDLKGTPGWELHDAMQPAPGDPILDKTTWDTFASTPLLAELESRGSKRLVIAGLQSEYCIRGTTLGEPSRGFEVVLVSDGHSTYDDDGRTATEISSSVNAELASKVSLSSAEQVKF